MLLQFFPTFTDKLCIFKVYILISSGTHETVTTLKFMNICINPQSFRVSLCNLSLSLPAPTLAHQATTNLVSITKHYFAIPTILYE